MPADSNCGLKLALLMCESLKKSEKLIVGASKFISTRFLSFAKLENIFVIRNEAMGIIEKFVGNTLQNFKKKSVALCLQPAVERLNLSLLVKLTFSWTFHKD